VTTDTNPADRPVLVYGNDPLCGWCFAIGPDLLAAKAELGEEVTWQLECGGLVVGERVRPVADDEAYLRAGLAQVEQVSGRRASTAYYDRVLGAGTWVSDSEPPCRAVLIVRDMAPDLVLDFSHGLTDALYLAGQLPDDPETIREVAERSGLDGAEVVRLWSDPSALGTTQEAFRRARAFGVTTYPSLFLCHGGTARELFAGWLDAAGIVARVRAAVTDVAA